MKKLFFLLLFSIPASAQSWSGLLAPNRAIDWSQAGAGTIPARATICTTLGTAGQAPTFAQSVSMATIQSALAACPAGETVLLNPGTYSTASSLISTTSNVTLRGSGPDQTILNFTGTSTNCLGIGPTAVCLGNGDSNALGGASNFCALSSGYSQGSTTLVAGSCATGSLSNLHVGSLIVVSQQDFSSDTGNWWPCGNANCSQQGDTGNVISGSSQIQVVTVTGISGSNISITPNIYAPNWNSSQSPQISFSSSLPQVAFGLEALQVNTQNVTSSNQAAMVQFLWAKNGWVKDVALINNAGTGNSMHKHVWVATSAHITVRDSYLYGASPTSEGYGGDFWESSDSLFENNICQHLPTCEITEGSQGGVFGHNYAVDNFYNGGGYAANWQQCDQFHHNAGDYYNLWEGNIGICHTQDSIHGTDFADTVFRNALSGFDPSLTTNGTSNVPKSSNLLTINNMAFARYNNYVMNVLGYGGHATTYQYAMASAGDCGPGSGNGYIYAIGDSDQNVAASTCGYGYTVPNDTAALATLMRWGNYDAVNAGVRTNSGETGSTAPTYAGLPTPSTSYASFPSLYLPNAAGSPPTWWNFPSGSTAPFPAIGPEVTGGNISGAAGHAWLNPAANNYLNVMGGATDGSSGVLAFDGSVYYPTGGVAVATGDSRTVTEPAFPAVCSQVQATKYIVQTTAVNVDPWNPTCGTLSGTNGTLGCTGGTDFEPSSTVSPTYTASESLDNTAVQNALNSCASGQAVELVPAAGGQHGFVLGPWSLPTGVGIILDAGIHVFASRNLSDYGGTNCGLVTTGSSSCNHWITAASTTGSGIYGYGVLDGRGWDEYIGQTTSFYANRSQAYCNNHSGAINGYPACTPNASGNNSYGPNALDLEGANSFTMYKVTVKDSANFGINWNGGNGFTAWDVKVIAPFEMSNTDGWDPINGQNATFTHGVISNGDNQVAIKASSAAASNITFSNNQTGAGIAIAIGSATQYHVSNVLVTDNTQKGNLNNGESAGLQIGSSGANGGPVDTVTFRNDCMVNEGNSLRFYTNYGGQSGSNTPIYTNLLLRNIAVLASTAGNSGKFTFQGLSGNPIQAQIDNLTIAGTNQGVASQSGVTTDQYANVFLGPGAVPSSILTQFSAGTGVTTTGSAGSSTPFCTATTAKPLLGELNLKNATSNNNQSWTTATSAPFTLQAVLMPSTEINSKESPALTQPVTFLDNGSSIGTVALSQDGAYAFIALSGATAGTHVYSVSYPGDSNYPAFTFGNVTVIVGSSAPNAPANLSGGVFLAKSVTLSPLQLTPLGSQRMTPWLSDAVAEQFRLNSPMSNPFAKGSATSWRAAMVSLESSKSTRR